MFTAANLLLQKVRRKNAVPSFYNRVTGAPDRLPEGRTAEGA
jgi:hypothetical protein